MAILHRQIVSIVVRRQIIMRQPAIKTHHQRKQAHQPQIQHHLVEMQITQILLSHPPLAKQFNDSHSIAVATIANRRPMS